MIALGQAVAEIPSAFIKDEHPRPVGLPSATFVSADRTLARNGRTFHWARRLMGDVHAQRATRLYSFCRYIDDLADETCSPAAAQDALGAIGHALRTGVTADPQTQDGIRLLEQCKIEAAIPLLLIEGVSRDLLPVRVTDLSELLRYCYHVAGTVGLMMSAALDVTDRDATPHAIDLGIAMQITNMCRDVYEDACAGRRYLPSTMVGEMQPQRLVAPTAEDRALADSSVLRLLDIAELYYASGEDGLAHLPQRARRGVLVAARVYRAIGTRVRHRNTWSARAAVSDLAKTVISARALMEPSREPCAHNPALHAALIGLPGTNDHKS